MQYVSVAEGRTLGGLRLVLSAGVPGPWGESAKAILRLRGVAYIAVAQQPMEANEDLCDWVGVRNAPVAVLNSEPPITGWRDILMLAERIGRGPSLLPLDSSDREECLNLANMICSAGGFGWQRRLMLMAKSQDEAPLPDKAPTHVREIMHQYGYSFEAAAAAPQRLAAFLRSLADRLRRQVAAGSEYLVGDRLSAADLYWACFSIMVAPLSQSMSPMAEWLRAYYLDTGHAIAAALDPLLIAHRDRIFERHIGLPLEY